MRTRKFLSALIPALPMLLAALLVILVTVIFLTAMRSKAHAQLWGVEQPMFQLTSVAAELPIPLADMQLWLKPQSVSYATNGESLIEWLDSSGNEHNATNISGVGTFPYAVTNALNGYPAVIFDGNGSRTFDFRTNTSRSMLRNKPGATIYAVMTYRDTAAACIPFFIRDSGGSRTRFGINQNLQFYGFFGKSIDADLDQTGSTGIAPTLGTNVFSLINIRVNYPGQSWSLHVNGVPTVSQTGMGWTASNTSDTDSSNVNPNGMGWFNYIGRIVEVIFYSTNHNDTQRLEVESYFTNKYGSFATWFGTNVAGDERLLAKYDVDALGLNDGDLIETLPDDGPLSYDLKADNSAHRPYWTNNVSIINGEGFASFNGTNNWLTNFFSNTYVQPTHIVMVSQSITNLHHANNNWLDNGPGVNQSAQVLNNDNVLLSHAGTGGNAAIGPPINNWIIWEWLFNGASSYVKTNNVTVFSGNLGANGRHGIVLGNDRIGPTADASKINIAWVGFYTNSLAPASLDVLIKSLGTRYGITTYTRN